VVNVHQFSWANETKLWKVRAEILMRGYLTPLLEILTSKCTLRNPNQHVKARFQGVNHPLPRLIWTYAVRSKSEGYSFKMYFFSKIWPGDLFFDPRWPIFKLGLDIAKANILTKFHQNRATNVASIVKTWFSKDLTWWFSFKSNMTHFRTYPRYCLDKHSDQVLSNLRSQFVLVT